MALAPAELELEPCGAPAAAMTSWELLRAACGPAALSRRCTPPPGCCPPHTHAQNHTQTHARPRFASPGVQPIVAVHIEVKDKIRDERRKARAGFALTTHSRHGLRVRHAAHRRAPRLHARQRASRGGRRKTPVSIPPVVGLITSGRRACAWRRFSWWRPARSRCSSRSHRCALMQPSR